MSVITLVVGTAAVIPFFFSRREKIPGGNQVLKLIDTHDLWMHLFIVGQFDKVLRSGIIYPRWIPDINRGYGLLNMIYYPPGFFYLTSAVHTVVSDWIDTVFVVSALALAGSGLALYFLARTFYGKLASAIAALFYMLIPFHLLDLYWRGALPQFVGYALLPLIVYFAFQLGTRGLARDYSGIGLTFGLFLLTHLPVALMLTYALGFYALVWSIRERNPRILLRISMGMFLGLLLGAIYWLPAAVEAKYGYENASVIFPYHESYITLIPPKLGIPYYTFWKLLNQVFVAQAIAIAAPLVILYRAPEPASSRPRRWKPTNMWIVMGLVTLFMCTSFSVYVSMLLPKLQVAVPAWRWLAIATVFTSLLIGAGVDRLRGPWTESRRSLLGYRLLLGGAIAMTILVSGFGVIGGALSNPTYLPRSESVAEIIEPNWTPKEASRPEALPDTPPVVLIPDGGSSRLITWEPQYRCVAVKTDVPAVVRFKTYYFPGWTARIDGQPAAMSSDGDGIQIVSVQPGIHKVEVSFVNTPPRTLGAAVSGIAALGIAALAGLEYLRVKRRRTSIRPST